MSEDSDARGDGNFPEDIIWGEEQAETIKRWKFEWEKSMARAQEAVSRLYWESWPINVQCQEYALAVRNAMKGFLDRDFDVSFVEAEERNLIRSDTPAHMAVAVKAPGYPWSSGLIIDAWPDGEVRIFEWDHWCPPWFLLPAAGEKCFTPREPPG